MQTRIKKWIVLCMVGMLTVTSTLTLRGTENGTVLGTKQDLADQKIDRPLKIEKGQNVIQEHELIAQNDRLELYLKKDTLSLIVRDKMTQAVMYSTVNELDQSSNETWQNFMQSGIVLEYIKGTNVNLYTADLLNKQVSKEITLTDTGFTAAISHPDIGISYQVKVELTEDGFTVEIPQENIVETSDEFKVGGFYIYPFLGHAEQGNRQGYMFIPDGTGALIYLQDNNGKFKQPFSNWIYGENVGLTENEVPSLFNNMDIVKEAQYLLAPVFGMVHTDSQIGVLGVVEDEGAYSAKIEAYPNGAVTKYDWITAHFIYRQVYNQPTSKSSGMIVARQKEMNHFDARISYHFVTGEEASYAGLANVYRENLVATGKLKQLSYDYKTRIDFLGAEKKNWLLFKRSVPMTTVDDVQNIYKALSEEGVTDLLLIYKGWQKDGISGGSATEGFKVEKSIGGSKKLEALIKSLEGTNATLYLDNDFLRMNPNRNMWMSHFAMKKVNKRIYEEETFKKVYEKYNYLIPSKTLDLMKENEKIFLAKGVKNIMLSDISNTLFSHYEKGVIRDRIDTASTYEEAIKTYQSSFNLLLEQPFSYLWKYSQAIIDTPMKGSNYIFCDEEVPFLAIVLKGMMPMYSTYVNFEANKEENFLKLIEQGIYPSFYITQEDPSKLLYTNSLEIYSSKFDFYKDQIVTYTQELKAFNEKVKGAVIIGHKKEDDLVEVKYSNGIVVYINYSNMDKKVNGLVIPAKAYKVGEF